MNFYLVVEGRRTEPRIYRAWLPFVRPGIQEVRAIEEASDETFYLVAGLGYPSYLRRISAAVKDIADDKGQQWCLVVAVDAEEQTFEERLKEVEETIDDAVVEHQAISVDRHILVADCCIESWLLGNQKAVPPSPQVAKLQTFKAFYDVRSDDPEKMPCHPDYNTRAQFHLDYLRQVCVERSISYSKNSPGPTSTRTWFDELVKRNNRTSHLQSFASLLALRKT